MTARVELARRSLVLGVVAAFVALLSLPWLGGEGVRAAALRGLAQREIDELALLAGVRDDQGQRLREQPLPVEVVQEAGSLWIAPAITEVVDASGWFAAEPSPHLLRIEVIEDPRALALALNLHRGGWDLRAPDPLRVRTEPWTIVLAGLLGAGIATWQRRISLGLACFGVLAQVLLICFAPPRELFAPASLVEEWSRGPLFGRILPALDQMPPVGNAAAAALLVFSLVLVGFDHKRSKTSSESMGLGSASVLAVLGTFGSVCAIEAMFRSGFAAAVTQPIGALALAGLTLAWVPTLSLALAQWKRQRSPEAAA